MGGRLDYLIGSVARRVAAHLTSDRFCFEAQMQYLVRCD